MAAGSRGVQLWDAATGKPLPEAQEAEVQANQTYMRRVRRADMVGKLLRGPGEREVHIPGDARDDPIAASGR